MLWSYGLAILIIDIGLRIQTGIKTPTMNNKTLVPQRKINGTVVHKSFVKKVPIHEKEEIAKLLNISENRVFQIEQRDKWIEKIKQAVFGNPIDNKKLLAVFGEMNSKNLQEQEKEMSSPKKRKNDRKSLPTSDAIPKKLKKPPKPDVEKGTTKISKEPLKNVSFDELQKPMKEGKSDEPQKPMKEGKSNELQQPPKESKSDGLQQPLKESKSDELQQPLKQSKSDELQKPLKEGKSDELQEPPKVATSEKTLEPLETNTFTTGRSLEHELAPQEAQAEESESTSDQLQKPRKTYAIKGRSSEFEETQDNKDTSDEDEDDTEDKSWLIFTTRASKTHSKAETPAREDDDHVGNEALNWFRFTARPEVDEDDDQDEYNNYDN